MTGAGVLVGARSGAPLLETSTDGVVESSMAWMLVYSGLAAFFLLGGQRFARPGYRLFAAARSATSVIAAAVALLFSTESNLVAFAAARVVVLVATVAPALNTHFLHGYTGSPLSKQLPYVGYLLAALALAADLGAALASLPVPERPTISMLLSPKHALAIFMASVFALHLLTDVVMLASALASGRKHVILPLVVMIVLGPAVVVSFYSLLVLGKSLMLTQLLTWVYALAILWGLLVELRGAEGRLEVASSSLAEKTAELQFSYAELDAVHEELGKKQQLAAVGELAAAIAHEVRNPLAIIMNASSGLRRVTEPSADRDTLLSIVAEESERLNELVTELLRFARPVEAARVPASVHDICVRVKQAAPENYEVRIHMAQDERLGSAYVDAGLFRLALDNVVTNAMQAMPSGGIVRISIQHGKFDSGEPAVEVRVEDRGVGMSREVLERAKNPFYTTRPRGTGLGLSIVERIVEAHGGQLDLESSEGIGTTVSIRVPIADAAPPSASRPPPSSGGRPRRRLASVPSVDTRALLARSTSQRDGSSDESGPDS